ncbi:class I SAM-dependent methyltransferase [Sphingomonas sp. So64.6b]|uniref:class I SAM-dependent DNA methyltransferase n=1 Tax=Sphingomonas sp. So64.6b TaxID=2997354 RepID=UPI0015FF3EB9|nr:class I SAM-dependent methyltransferase [Sphingomonas sp. So64.6b]QNA84653.1 class I SAM-dependent methyltransferase [Sphingomonas sp. So64.6b]
MPDAHRRLFAAQSWLDRFTAALPRGGAILDLGCGGGEPIARYLIDHGFRLTGVDSDVVAIDLARTRFPRDTWIHADMRIAAIDGQFDGIIAWDSLTGLSRADQAMMADRVGIWLKPGGRLLFNARDDDGDLGPIEYSAAIARRGLIEMAHVVQDPAWGGADVWLARKP